MVENISADEIVKSIERLLEPWPYHEFIIYTSGTGIPCQTIIDFYKNTNQLIIDRNGTKWRRGMVADE